MLSPGGLMANRATPPVPSAAVVAQGARWRSAQSPAGCEPWRVGEIGEGSSVARLFRCPGGRALLASPQCAAIV